MARSILVPRRVVAALASCLLLSTAVPALAAPPPTPSSSTPSAAVSGEAQFVDISGNFAAADITILSQAGVIPVPTDRLFHPNAPITRLSFAEWTARALELPVPAHPATFTDESQIPQADQGLVAATVAAGLIHGYPGGSFEPSNSITRAELSTVLGRVLESKGQVPQARFAALFVDGNTIPNWALPALLLVQDRLIRGLPCSPEACFAPNSDTTRAEAAKILVRFMQYMTTNYHAAPLPKPTYTAPFEMGMWYSDSAEGYSQLVSDGSNLNELIFGGYNIEGGGQLVGYDSPRTLTWARQHPDTALWVMIQADSLSFLADPAQQPALISQVVAMVRRAGYVGVNFDIEGVPASEAASYQDFIATAAAQLHAIGAKISVAVPTETAFDHSYPWDAAYNYKALGQVVDQVIMMAYDFHYPGGAPGPIAPIAWDQEAISYAVSQMAPQQVILGVPAYGYIWNTSTDAALGYWETGMFNEAAAHGATVTQMSGPQESTFSYTQSGTQYVGWFVDGQDVAARLALAHQAGIGGVVAWRLDYQVADWWQVWSHYLAAWS